eukprot:scaffold11495_cov132-Isochrysis_galbana.AAC.9
MPEPRWPQPGAPYGQPPWDKSGARAPALGGRRRNKASITGWSCETRPAEQPFPTHPLRAPRP